MGTYDLPTNIAPGSTSHATLHNNTNVAVNDLDTRVSGLAAGVAQSLFIPATSFVTVSGSPTLTGAAPVAYPRWLLDRDTTEIINTVIMPPIGWTTAKVRLYWTAEATNAGVARLEFRSLPVKVAGDVLNTGETAQAMNLSVPNQAVLTITEFPTAIAVATADVANRPLLQFSIRRAGADANDNYSTDVGIIGIALVKAS